MRGPFGTWYSPHFYFRYVNDKLCDIRICAAQRRAALCEVLVRFGVYAAMEKEIHWSIRVGPGEVFGIL